MRQRNKRFCRWKGLPLFFALVLACSLPITAFAAKTTMLGIDRVQEAKAHWCWAACGEMIGTYVNSNSDEDQWSIVEKVKGTIFDQHPNQEATDAEIEEAIEMGSANTVNYASDNSVRSFADHQSDIDGGYPVCAQMQWQSGGKHAMVVAGYTTGTQNMLILIDPGRDCTRTCYSYSALINGITVQSGTGSYINSYYHEKQTA